MNFLGMGPGELILIMVLALIVFGPQKLPEIASGMGKAIGEFRRASTQITEELSREMRTDSLAKEPRLDLPPQEPMRSEGPTILEEAEPAIASPVEEQTSPTDLAVAEEPSYPAGLAVVEEPSYPAGSSVSEEQVDAAIRALYPPAPEVPLEVLASGLDGEMDRSALTAREPAEVAPPAMEAIAATTVGEPEGPAAAASPPAQQPEEPAALSSGEPPRKEAPAAEADPQPGAPVPAEPLSASATPREAEPRS